MLQGLRVVVDVQHLFRPGKPNDRGSVYRLANGSVTDEGSSTLIYAAALKARLEQGGATVVTNDPARGILVGPYSTRNRSAVTFHAYLACHLNAGGGNYALTEYMSMTDALPLAAAIKDALLATFPTVIPRGQTRALSSNDRGAVCIERVPAPCVAVLCEPFFGDHPGHQALLAAPQLHLVGEAIADGVAAWWAPPV
jgi:N-acetylmuramoyl-L-alanine amidase